MARHHHPCEETTRAAGGTFQRYGRHGELWVVNGLLVHVPRGRGWQPYEAHEARFRRAQRQGAGDYAHP